MTTYGVTNDGFVRKPFSVVRSEIEDYQRTNVDSSLILSDRSLLGQVNVSVTNQLAELWELAQGVYASQYPDSSNGWNLDQVCALTGSRRSDSSKTTVPGRVTLSPFKNLPAGSVAHLTDQPNARFVTLTEVPANPAGGTFDVSFEAEEAGATTVAIGQLDQIAEPVDGWTAGDNLVAGDTGTQREEDDELRLKREAELEAQGSTNVDSIRADLLRVENVVDAVVTENDEDYVVNGLKPHSVYCILRGGASADIAQSIFDTKAAGINTNGSESAVVKDSQGFDHTMYWDNAIEKVIHTKTTIETDPLVFDISQGPTDIKTNIVDYYNSLGIGNDVIYDQVKCAIFKVPGVKKVVTLKIGFVDPPTGTGDLAIAHDEFASGDVANVDVTPVLPT
jgi:uncharacterized phage protein gp47/JayE